MRYKSLLESLSYTVTKEKFITLDLKDYKKIEKNGVFYYIKDNEEIFYYIPKKNKLVVTKQGYQLMNIERGF